MVAVQIHSTREIQLYVLYWTRYLHSLVLSTRRGSEISLNDFELHIFRCLCILFVLVLLLRLSQIQIAFFQFSLTHPNDCETNFVDVFGERTDIPTR